MSAANAVPRPAAAAVPPARVERIPIGLAGERSLDLFALEHETLPPPHAVSREGDALIVSRRPPPGRPVREGRVPRDLLPQLLLQASGAIAFFQAHGFALASDDLGDALWDRHAGGARLWLTRAPGTSSPGTPASEALASFPGLVSRGGGRARDREVRSLAERLEVSDAGLRRPEFLVAAVLRSFPSLADAAAAGARRRTAGRAGAFLLDLRARALREEARALSEGRRIRLFLPAGSALRAGDSLGLDPPPSGGAEAAGRLRELALRDASRGRAVWIAAGAEAWDPLSRRAFDAARSFLPPEIEVRLLPSAVPAPALPHEWRREIWVPCGSFAATLRFYEWLAVEAREDPAGGGELAGGALTSVEWAAFATDPTGEARLPVPSRPQARPTPREAAEREALTYLAVRGAPATASDVARVCGRSAGAALPRLRASGDVEETRSGWRLTRRGRPEAAGGVEAAALCRRWAARERDPARRIELLLSAGAGPEALVEAERWYRSAPSPAENWFALAARLSAACVERPAWLDLLEAERELSGGRPAESRTILDRVGGCEQARDAERRAARLRAAEVAAWLEGASKAGRLAGGWRAAFPSAPAAEMVRALRLEAAGLAREGESGAALERLEEADRLAEPLGPPTRLENALARAGVLGLAGRHDEEERIYAEWRGVAAQSEGTLAARFYSQEALALCDRRRFPEAAARLEEALAILRDDPAERARLSIDLAATLYHAGRPERCAALLEEAAERAASAGRRDLLRVARSNRIELWIERAEWESAGAAIERMLEDALREEDELWRMVALHHRGRMALRRGDVDGAAADTAAARELALRRGDRLEIGELWLEEGDLCLYRADRDGARRAWERAAADPPDRCDTERLAAGRLGELAWSADGGPPAAAREALGALLSRGDYAAAETAARWRLLFPRDESLQVLAASSERLLRERGGEALADRVFGRREPAAAVASVPTEAVRRLREGLASCLAGESDGADLVGLGVAGLQLAEADGREVLRIGRLAETQSRARGLEAGAGRYRLVLAREIPEPLAATVAMLLETLLFRPAAGAAPADFARGWRRFGIVTEDASMEEPYRRLARFAAQPVTVLVQGESGSGKEAVARAVHALSPRAGGPFVAINVPAIPAALLESELFGHVRGAFTGAERERVGLLEEAARGTIFFDEIGDLEPALQSKLLRALQEGEIRRLGENRARHIDVRVVSATSRNLARDVEAGRFREDLYYRLHVAVIALPPLRERGRDALRLARHFLEVYGKEYGRGTLRLSPEAALALSAHLWPGNVRELQNAMAQAAALADSGGVVGLAHLPEAARPGRPRAARETYRSRLDAHRKGMISDALGRSGGNRSLAARELGLSRQALRYLIKELNVSVPSAASARTRGPV